MSVMMASAPSSAVFGLSIGIELVMSVAQKPGQQAFSKIPEKMTNFKDFRGMTVF